MFSYALSYVRTWVELRISVRLWDCLRLMSLKSLPANAGPSRSRELSNSWIRVLCHVRSGPNYSSDRLALSTHPFSLFLQSCPLDTISSRVSCVSPPDIFLVSLQNFFCLASSSPKEVNRPFLHRSSTAKKNEEEGTETASRAGAGGTLLVI